MSLLEKIKKNSSIKETSILSMSKFFLKKDMIPTDIPAINLALSGKFDGGLTPGLTTIAGESRRFKTLFSLVMAKAYLKKYPEGVLLFYDSEFGTPQSYFTSNGIDLDRVIHTPIMNVEELKYDIVNQLNLLDRDDRVMIIVDSIGNLASKKEIDDALDQKAVADMTRSKQLKSLFRMVTPYLNTKNIPMIIVAHTYKTLEMFSKDVVSGGTGSQYASDTIWIIGRQQEKEGTDLIGYNFIINIDKSRYVREKSKIPITVTFEGGIQTYSGLIDIALESGHVIKPSNGWYSKKEELDKKYRLKDTNNSEFWSTILLDPSFNEWVNSRYQITKPSVDIA